MNIHNQLKTTIINTNLISLTGYRTIIIFYLLSEGPKTLEEIKSILIQINPENHNISSDTIRKYINSLRSLGCEISKATKLNSYKFIMTNHPLLFDITPKQIKALQKISKRIIKTGSLFYLERFEDFILKLISIINNNETKELLHGILIVNKLDKNIYEEIKKCCQEQLTVTMLYKSADLEEKRIQFLCNKIFLRSEKIYVEGFSNKYKKNSFLLLSRIKEIIFEESLKYEKPEENNYAICEIYDKNFKINTNENILESYDNKFVIKITESNSFMLYQQILSYGSICKVLYPQDLKLKIKETIKEMSKFYVE